MEFVKILVLFSTLAIGAKAAEDPRIFAADPLTTSFTGSCLVRSRVVTKKLSDFDVKIVPGGGSTEEQVMRFTVPVENGHDVDLINFVAHAIMQRKVSGWDWTGLKISSPDRTNEASMRDAQPGTVLNSMYYIRAGRIWCEGTVK